MTTDLGATRTRVLAALQDARRPLTTAELAGSLSLHGNTARFHLQALVSAGLVERGPEARTSPGRPSIMYAASPAAPDVGQRNYRLLAEILIRHLQPEPPQASGRAESAGEAWGRGIASAVGTRPTKPGAAAQTVVDALATLGFDSRAVQGPDGRRIDIVPCPFLELAETDGQVVCAVHRGLMKGLLEELDAPLRVKSLTPFVEPHRCAAHLRSA